MPATATYTQFTTYFTLPEASNDVWVVLGSTFIAAGDTYYDDVSLKEVTNIPIGATTIPANGTSVIWWKPSFDRADGGTNYYLSTHGASGGQMIYTPTAGDPESAPGGVNATVALAFTKDTWYKLVVKWGYLESYIPYYQIGYDSGSGIVWGTQQIFDGKWRVGSSLVVGRGIDNPYHIKRVWIYDQVLTDAEIDALPAPDA